AAMPDAVLHLATVPSRIALTLIRSGGYRLVGLPFAEAFRLGGLFAKGTPGGDSGEVERPHGSAPGIPPVTYQIGPAIPAAPLHTIGARLALVANASVPAEAVARVLDTIFSAEVAQVTSPPLDPSVMALPSQAELHPGAIDYLRRDKPYVTDDTVSALS